MRLLLVLSASLALLTACGTNESPLDSGNSTTTSSDSSTTTEGETDQLNADTPIGADGLGPVKAGMTLAEVREAAAPRELVLEGFEDFEGYCWIVRVEGLEEDFSLLFLAPERTEPVQDADAGELGRASSYGDLDSSPAASTGGPGIGSTKDEVMEAYDLPSHSVAVTPHEYVEGGEYIDVSGSKDPEPLLLRFETDAEGSVTAIHGGLRDAVQLVEGCA